MAHQKESGSSNAAALTSKDLVPNPLDSWSPSKVTESMLLDMEQRGVLPLCALLPWRSEKGEAFPTENSGETVVFTSFFERGFSLPTGSFFRGLLLYYGLELTHLTPNSIGSVAFL